MALTCSSKNSVNKFLKPNCDQDLLQTERFCFQWDIPCLKNFIRIHQQLLELLAKIHKIDPILFLKFYKKNSVSTLWSRSPPKTNQDLSIVDIKRKRLHTCEYTCVHIAVKKNCHKIFTRICTFITVQFFTTCRIYTLQNYHEWLIWHRMGICNVIWSTSTNMSSIS